MIGTIVAYPPQQTREGWRTTKPSLARHILSFASGIRWLGMETDHGGPPKNCWQDETVAQALVN